MAEEESTPVLLIKTKSKPTDLYEECLLSSWNRYEPIFIPCLYHQIIDDSVAQIEELIVGGSFLTQYKRPERRFRRSISHVEELVLGRSFIGGSDEPEVVDPRYGGIIFTSQRAVEAFGKVIKNIDSSKDPPFKLEANTVLYVVGSATERALRALNLPCPIRGAETGNGDALAEFILKDFKSTDGWKNSKTKPGLLFLVGEQRRDVIPKTLQAESLPENERIKVEELEVYKTIEDPEFGSNFDKEWKNHGGASKKQWIVVFSPSGSGTILEKLGMLDSDRKLLTEGRNGLTKIATIGPTTRDYVQKEFGFTPHAVAKTPTPEGVRDAIESV